MSQFRVLLAATIENDEVLKKLHYPLIGSPKVDGIRCFIHHQFGPVTRKLKPIPNNYIRRMLGIPALMGCDGEIVVGATTAKDGFNQTASGVMTQGGTSDFTFWVFDRITPVHPNMCYEQRLAQVSALSSTYPDYVKVLPSFRILNADAALSLEKAAVQEGYEGLMLRSPEAQYKMGRSTLREQILLKLKRFQDAEAVIVGYEPLERNNNAPTKNALGLQERSSHQAGKVAINTLGNLIVEHPTFGQFSIGSGFDSALRAQIWTKRKEHLGRTVTFKYQSTGVKDKPRFPIFKGFRPDGA